MLAYPDTLKLSSDPGMEMYQLIRELYPICRSITGNGFRRSLDILRLHIPLQVHEVPSGTPVFDWTVPKEWNITDAYIKDRNGQRVVDFQQSNLHVVNYSLPIKKAMRLSELRGHLFTLPDHPDWIPYRTSYYKESWGFCLSQNLLDNLADDEYEVCIDASLQDGYLTYGEYYIAGEISDEILISCHACHPSLCNDNLSGVAIATFLAQYLSSQALRYSYRFLFIPGTIGSITWLSKNQGQTAKIKHGLVLSGLGDNGPYTYKKSRWGDADIDKVMRHILQHSGKRYNIIDFFPYGYDERQYCSPGFNLPVGCFMRTPHGQYSEYHTSADNLDFVKPEALAESWRCCLTALNIIENNRIYLNQNPYCEPQLGKRNLYRAIGGEGGDKNAELALLWVLNLSDGNNSLLDIAERSGLRFEVIHTAAEALGQHGLLREV